MIARVAIAADALRPSDGATVRQLRATHERLTATLAAHGILVLGDAPSREEFMAALRELATRSPDAYKVWEVLISAWQGNRRVLSAAPQPTRPLDTIDDRASLRDDWGGKAKLAILSDAQATTLGIPPDDLSINDADSGIELVRIDDADQAALLKKFRDRAERHTVAADTRREDIWREFLKPLVSEALTITIRDRYVGKSLFRGQGGDRQSNELEWLLDRIDRDGRAGITVRLLIGTAPPGNDDRLPADAASVAAELRRGWLRTRPGSAIKRIEIIGVTDPKHQEAGTRRVAVPHDRWILFDGDRAIEFPAGLDRLRRFKTSENITVTYHWRPSDITKYASEADQILRHPTRSDAELSEL